MAASNIATSTGTEIKVKILQNTEVNCFCKSGSITEFPPLPSPGNSVNRKDENESTQQLKSEPVKTNGISSKEINLSHSETLVNVAIPKCVQVKDSSEGREDVILVSDQIKKNEIGESFLQATSSLVKTLSQEGNKLKGKKNKKKLKQVQQNREIEFTPEANHSLINEEKITVKNVDYTIDINNREEYPELSIVQHKHFLSGDNIISSRQTEIRNKGKLKHVTIPAISSHRSNFGSFCSRSFSDILKTTTVPSTSLKFKNSSMQEAMKNHDESLMEESSVERGKHQSQRKNQVNKSSHSAIAEKKVLSSKIIDTSETKKVGKKPQHTPLNLSDFLVKLSPTDSGKIRKQKTNLKIVDKKRNILTPRNTLDATAPLRKRGKEREEPKKKHLSTLKKIILKEKMNRKDHINNIISHQSPPETKENCNCTVNNDSFDHHTCEMSQQVENTNLENKLMDNQTCGLLNSNVEAEKIDFTEIKKCNITKQLLHGRKFREYCDQLISQDIDDLLSSFLGELVRYQDRLHQKDPVKAKTKKRLVCGLKEVTKHLRLKKLKIIVITPDVERINSEGGLDDMLTTLLKTSSEYNTPCVFGLSRRKVGGILKKKVPVSCVGIFNYEGTEEIYKQLMEKVNEARCVYEKYFKNIYDALKPDMIESANHTISVQEKEELWKKIAENPDNKNLDYNDLPTEIKKKE